MELVKINREQCNSLIVILFVFQYAIMQPISSLLNSQLPLLVSTLLLLIWSLIVNRFEVYKSVYFFIMLIIIYFLISLILFDKQMEYSIITFFEFLGKCLPALIVATFALSAKHLIHYAKIMSIITLLIITPSPLYINFDSMNYMRYGYAILPSILIFIYLSYLTPKLKLKLFYFILSIVSILMLLVFGSRGALISIIMFLIFMFLLLSNKSKMYKSFQVVLSVLLLVIIITQNIIIKILYFIQENLNIYSYSITKFILLIENGMNEGGSGRNEIYSTLIEIFKDNPIFGGGISVSNIQTGFTAHNFLLQIVAESGVVGLMFWMCIFFLVFKVYFVNPEQEIKLFLSLLISLAFGRLFISSDLWLRPEYWMAIGVAFNYWKTTSGYQLSSIGALKNE